MMKNDNPRVKKVIHANEKQAAIYAAVSTERIQINSVKYGKAEHERDLVNCLVLRCWSGCWKLQPSPAR